MGMNLISHTGIYQMQPDPLGTIGIGVDGKLDAFVPSPAYEYGDPIPTTYVSAGHNGSSLTLSPRQPDGTTFYTYTARDGTVVHAFSSSPTGHEMLGVGRVPEEIHLHQDPTMQPHATSQQKWR
jgi:hypothetical protein